MEVTARDINLRAAEILMENDLCQKGDYHNGPSEGGDANEARNVLLANAYCMRGAQGRAFTELVGGSYLSQPLWHDAGEALERVVIRETALTSIDTNDDPSTTKEDCILWLKKAAEL